MLESRTLYKVSAASDQYNEEDMLYSYEYEYDSWGNIIDVSYIEDSSMDGGQKISEAAYLSSVTMSYDSSNRMISYNGEDIEYDADGNMTYGPLNGEMVQYEYDCRNRLIQAGDEEYTYDAEGVRLNTITSDYKEEYITDSVGSLSRVLEVSRTYNDDIDDASREVYFYGSGLGYEKLYDSTDADSRVLVYHYDHLGSTRLITDENGDIVVGYRYGTYGELLPTENMDSSEDDLKIRFLYNGQFGVMTDDNGLYYMRARYYNPDIKRFINQDILTGSITNSASLNRYSYVQGNPVSYTDPFGREPFSYFTDKVRPSVIAHTALDVLGCLPGGSFFDVANAALYASEGNYKEAVKSLVFAIPGMDLGGKAGKYLMKGTKASKVFGTTLNVVDKTGKAFAIGIAANDFGNQAAYMIDKYMVNGEDISWDTAYEVLALGATGFQVTQFSKPFMVTDVKDVAKDIMSDNRGLVDLNALTNKGGSGSDLDGVRIINKKYAGKTFELSGDLGKKYPKGVNFSKEGFPEFEPYSMKKVTINNLEGDAYYDFIKANEAAGYSSTPAGYTWHHVEDGKTMLLVPSDLHGAVRHTGGASLIRKGIRP